ncbi:unnamed protein product, partial [marine sediment metagenome]
MKANRIYILLILCGFFILLNLSLYQLSRNSNSEEILEVEAVPHLSSDIPFEQAWNVTWGGTEIEETGNLAIDSLDNIYVAGLTRSFGNGEAEIFLVKYDTSGHQIW